MAKKTNQPRWQQCNIFRSAETGRRLWNYRVRSGGVALASDHAAIGSETIPGKPMAKDWQTLWRKKLNVGWLPPDQAFLGVVHLPAEDDQELENMIEFQLEKLSPLPVTQLAWTYHVLPTRQTGQKSVLLVMCSRHVVEAHLGQLEKEGFLSDRLELPVLDELFNLDLAEDGLWIFPRQHEDHRYCLSAWIVGGEFRNIGLIHLPDTDQWHEVLKLQLRQAAWAGQLGGWLQETPPVHLVAGEDDAHDWEPVLKDFSGRDIEVHAPREEGEMATATATRCVRSEPLKPLMPGDVVARYHQMFIDRIWMRFVGMAMLVYLFGVLAYFGALEYRKYQNDSIQSQFSQISRSYTNALELKSRVQVLQDQLNLKYAALDSWKIASENLPAGLTLTSLSFSRGKTLSLHGTVPMNQPGKVTEYVASLKEATLNGDKLFASVSSPTITSLNNNQARWDFSCELLNAESGR